MSALPYDLSEQSSLEVVTAIRQSQAVDGTLRYVDMGSINWSRITCVVEALSDDDRDTLMAFLSTNETSDIDVLINSVTYRGKLMPSMPPRWSRSSGRNTVTFGMQARAV